ncbi:MAG: hypothetical protein QW756_04715 [Nitrososphaerota archaeon]
MIGSAFDSDGLDYIYYGAIAAAVAALFTMIAMVAGGSVAGAVIGVLGGLAFLGAGGLWVIGFGRYRAYYRAAMGYGPPVQQATFPGPAPPPPPPPPSQSSREQL